MEISDRPAFKFDEDKSMEIRPCPPCDLNINRWWRKGRETPEERNGRLIPNERNGLNEPRNQVKGWDTNGCVWETASKRWKSCLAPWLLVFPKRGGIGGGRERDAKQFILGPPLVFSFGIGEMQRCFLQRMHYFSLRRCGSIMFVSFIQGALCGRHSFRGTLWCNALWLIVLRSTWKAFVTRTRSSLNARAESGDVQSQAR